MIRIIIADDHTLVRAGVRRLIESEKDLEVIGDTGTGRETVQMCREKNPDVLVLDFDMGDMDGIEITRQILSTMSGMKILILTMHDNEEYAVRLIQAGASGFIVKGTSPDELIKAIRNIGAGKKYISASVVEGVAFRHRQSSADNPVAQLSERELQVLIRLAQGRVIREISDELNLSSSTVETYKKRILEKLDLRNISDLTRFAIRHELIDKY